MRRTGTMNRRVLIFCCAGTCCAVIASYGQTPQTIFLPAVNLAATETAQISITSSAAGYVGGAFLASCNASVTFYGADGAAIGTAANFMIGDTRESYSADLAYASTGANGSSTVISAKIALTPKGGVFDVLAPPIPPCAVAFSLDTHDTDTGVTHAFIPGWAAQGTAGVTSIGAVSVSPCLYSSLCSTVIPEQQSPQNIVLPPVGVGATETAQVSLVNTAPASPGCSGSVSFYDTGGSLASTAASFTLGTGQRFRARLPYASAGAAGSSALIRAEIALSTSSAISLLSGGPSAPSTPWCELAFSLETFDSATGITHASVSGAAVQELASAVARNRR
jgi:hypothetical protein